MWKAGLIIALLCHVGDSAYVWPSKYDHIEDLLYMQSGFIVGGSLPDLVHDCAFNANSPPSAGVQKSAQWVRTAFHDAATHDASAKTGGLDASIQFELGRPEDFGAALNQTLADISSDYTTQTSAADLLALAFVLAVGVCGNFHIPLRLGRIDATHAGPFGVPEPQTDLSTTTKRFAGMGFSQSEMISVVACGHTLGNLHPSEHRDIYPNSTEPTLSFDTTPANFDNKVVTEWLDDSTKNPLVRAANNTFNSDKRIFGADGNVTMHALSDTATFKSTCEAVFTKMLDLVPGDVVLTDPLQPTDVKPYITSYQVMDKGTVQLIGRIRVRTSPSTGRDASSLTLTLHPKDRANKTLPAVSTTMDTGTSGGYGETFNWFEFNTNISSSAIRSFDISLASGSATTSFTNGHSGGFPLNPGLFYQLQSSCVVYNSAGTRADLIVRAAVRSAAFESGYVPEMVVVNRVNRAESPLPRLVPQTYAMQKTGTMMGDFVIYEGRATLMENSLFGTTFDLRVGSSMVLNLETNAMSTDQC